MSAHVAFFLYVLGWRTLPGQAQILLYRGVGKPKAVNDGSQTRSVRGYRGRCFVLFAESIVLSNDNSILHATALRFVTFFSADDQFRQSVRVRRVCLHVLHLRALLFLTVSLNCFESHGIQECIQRERCGRKHWTEVQTRRNPHVSPGMFPGSFLC